MTALLLTIGAVAYGVPIPGSTFPAFVFYLVLGTATMCSLGIALSAFTPQCRRGLDGENILILAIWARVGARLAKQALPLGAASG